MQTIVKDEGTIEQMFNGIAGSYDFLNHFFSLGIDKIWRNHTVNALQLTQAAVVLDIATGTADIAIAIAKKINTRKIIGIDISENMLSLANKKILKKNLSHKIELIKSSAAKMPFEDNTFDAITIGFGIRNFSNIDQCLKEIHRVLKKNGTLCILEFSKPENYFIRKFYNLYFSFILPFIGNCISRHKYAYSYLNKSVFDFPYGEKFNDLLKKNSFVNIKNKPLTFGIATLYTSNK